MSLPVFQATIVNDSGDIIPSAVITVLDEVTGLGVTVYSNRAGTVPLGTNGVFTAGVDGFAQFYAPPGNYRVKAEQAASGFEKTWDFVVLTGTAAEKDVQTSPTDATAGALMAVGAFGVGAASLPDQDGLDANAISVLGWNYASNPVNGPTAGTTKFFTFPSTIGGGRGSQMAYPVNTDGIWYRTQNSSASWSDWKRIDPQAFGFGTGLADAEIFTGDVLTLEETRSLRVSSTAVNLPSGKSGYMSVKQRLPNYKTLTYEDDSNRVFKNTLEAGVWSGWQPVYTGANLVQAINNSGGTVNGGSTTAGSNLNPAQSGIWRPSTTTANGAWNIWEKQ